MKLLEVQGIGKKEKQGNGLIDINFTQKRFEKIAIAGETGCGKSTLLKIIAGLTQPDAGNTFFDGKRVKGPYEELIPGHKGIAYLYQNFDLPHFLTVEQVLIYANPLLDTEAEKDPFALSLYETCRIAHLLKRRTDQLSGGEKQRVALTRLLISQPKLLLLDEPFSNLDMIHKNILKEVIAEISDKLEITCTLVSHDPLDTLSWADTIIVMKEGKIVQQGMPEDVYKKPENEYVAGLFGKYNLLPPQLSKILLGAKYKSTDKEGLFIRPEHLIVTKTEKELAIKGIIYKTYYYGSHSELAIRVERGYIITVKTTHSHSFDRGHVVYVSLLQ